MRTSNRHFTTLQTTSSWSRGRSPLTFLSRLSVFILRFFCLASSSALFLRWHQLSLFRAAGRFWARRLTVSFSERKTKTNLMLSFQAGGKGYVYILVQKRFVDCSKTKWNKLRNLTNTTTTRAQKAQNANNQNAKRKQVNCAKCGKDGSPVTTTFGFVPDWLIKWRACSDWLMHFQTFFLLITERGQGNPKQTQKLLWEAFHWYWITHWFNWKLKKKIEMKIRLTG